MSRGLRICMVVPYDLAEEGGVKRHAMQLAVSLRKRGDEVDVIGPCTDPKAITEHVYGFRGVINIRSNESDNRLGIFANPLKVWRLFQRREYDVVHVHEPLQPALNYYAIWSASTAAARIATFHAFMENESAALRGARHVWGAIAFPSYDRGIAVSPAALETARVVFTKPMAIIPNGIRTALYREGGPPVPGAPLKLLFVGHWRDSRKGLPILLEACARLRDQGIAWTLDVVGDGGQVPRSDMAGITYHGPIRSEERIAEIYAGCDVFVSPATGNESFGIVLLEAMASGRAIACSDIPGFRFAVGEGKESAAKLFAPTVEGVTAALVELAEHPAERARLGKNGLARVGRFDWEHLVGQVRDEYVAALAVRATSLGIASPAEHAGVDEHALH